MKKFFDAFWAFWIVVWCFGLVGSALQAQPPLTITERGYFLTTVDADGVPQYVQLTNVIDLTDGGGPPPPDNPDVDLELVKKVKGWAAATKDPIGAQAVAAVYSHVRGALADGTLNKDNVFPALKDATDKALATVGTEADWQPFRDELTLVFTEAVQRARLETVAQINRLLVSVQQGLELAADGSTAIEMDILTKIARGTNEAIDEAN